MTEFGTTLILIAGGLFVETIYMRAWSCQLAIMVPKSSLIAVSPRSEKKWLMV
jgi:hypothetical protein